MEHETTSVLHETIATHSGRRPYQIFTRTHAAECKAAQEAVRDMEASQPAIPSGPRFFNGVKGGVVRGVLSTLVCTSTVGLVPDRRENSG